MTSDTEYFSKLYEIASSLNKEFSLHAALKLALEKTVRLFELEAGWIWMGNEKKTIHLAASYNLPPAMKEHPELLSGTCYCIEKYFSNTIHEAQNISEIVCSRLKNVKSGTASLKFHATIPIVSNGEKVGLINLVSKESHQLTNKQLSVLNTISELIALVIQRTISGNASAFEVNGSEGQLKEAITKYFIPGMKELLVSLGEMKGFMEAGEHTAASLLADVVMKHGEILNETLHHIITESLDSGSAKDGQKSMFTSSPLTTRELELLALVKKGYTNKQAAETLFISERTVKFHITSILSKLSAKTRTEAVNIALKRGLISFHEL